MKVKTRKKFQLGIKWKLLEIGIPVLYRGTIDGAKSNACRASKNYKGKSFRSYAHNGRTYIERVK